jgi:hypothetical protein
MGWPALNALVVNNTDYMPSDPYWVKIEGHHDLGKCWSNCWKLGKTLSKLRYVALARDLDQFIAEEI